MTEMVCARESPLKQVLSSGVLSLSRAIRRSYNFSFRCSLREVLCGTQPYGHAGHPPPCSRCCATANLWYQTLCCMTVYSAPDPSSTERKGRRHLLADSASFCRGVPASPRKADSWSRNSRSFPRATLENVKEISTCLNAERSGLGASMRTRVLVCVYHLSEVRMSICDTLFRPFAETFE